MKIQMLDQQLPRVHHQLPHQKCHLAVPFFLISQSFVIVFVMKVFGGKFKIS
jgi:hypothetical protein